MLAFDVAVDRLVAARVGLGGAVLERRTAEPVAGRRRPGDRGVGARPVRPRTAPGRARRVRCASGAGASYCGMIRPEDGTVRFGPDMGWVDQAFGAELGRRLGLGLAVAGGQRGSPGRTAPSWNAGPASASATSSTCTVTSAWAAGSSSAARCSTATAGYGCELGHMLVNPYDGRRVRLRLRRLPGGRGRRAGPARRGRLAARALRPRAGRRGRRRGRTRRRRRPAGPCGPSATGWVSAWST